MFTVSGQLAGSAVSLTYDNGDPLVGGVESCDPALWVALVGAIGQPVPLTVTGPWVPLALTDANAVFAWLGQALRDVTVTGTPPEVTVADVPEGALA